MLCSFISCFAGDQVDVFSYSETAELPIKFCVTSAMQFKDI